MTVRTYIVTFYGPTANVAGFNQFVTTNTSVVLAYWNYIPLVYFIKSYLLASQLNALVSQYFPQGQLVIAEINAQNLDGRLPQEAWDWFYAPLPASPARGGIGAIPTGGFGTIASGGVGAIPAGGFGTIASGGIGAIPTGGLGAIASEAIPPLPGGMPGAKPRR